MSCYLYPRPRVVKCTWLRSPLILYQISTLNLSFLKAENKFYELRSLEKWQTVIQNLNGIENNVYSDNATSTSLNNSKVISYSFWK